MARDSNTVIWTRGLTKRYGDRYALRGVDLDVRRGEIVALLGPNGAGKTTALEILEGFRRPSGGQVGVLGADPARGGPRWRERVGVVLQESLPEPGLTARECLELYAGYYTRPRGIEETVALVGLQESADVLGERLSGGQRRRLDVALALIGDPELLFLDEPTAGFDPAARRAAWGVIEELRALGKTILLTTHYMDEAERLADRITVLVGGRIVADGRPGALGGRDGLAATIRFTLPPAGDVAELPPALQALAERDGDGAVTLHSAAPLRDLHALTGWALGRELDLPDLDLRRPTLEDVYLTLTEAAER